MLQFGYFHRELCYALPNTDEPWRLHYPVTSTSFIAAVRNLAMKQTGNIVSLNGREPWSFVLRLEQSILECWHMILYRPFRVGTRVCLLNLNESDHFDLPTPPHTEVPSNYF